MIYNIIFILLLCLSYYYDFCSHRNGRKEWYYAILVFFILFAGLRWRLGIDTPNYIYHFYYSIPEIEKLTDDDINFGSKPLWILLNSAVKTLGGRYYVVQLIESAFVNTLILNYFKRHSRYVFTCIFFYYVFLYLSFSFTIMKAAISIVVCLYANDFILKKKWIKGYMLYLISVMFHPQAILIMLTPFLLFLKLNKKSVLLFFLLFVLSLSFQEYLGDSLYLFDFDENIYDKAEKVATLDRYSSRISNFNFAVANILPYFIYAILSLFAIKRFKPNSNMLKFESLMVIYLCFIVIEMNVYIAYRFALYYSVYFIIFLSETYVEFASLGRNSKYKTKVFSKSLLLVLPFLLLMGYVTYQRAWIFNPYSTVIEREIDQTREKNRLEIHPNGPRANTNEY